MMRLRFHTREMDFQIEISQLAMTRANYYGFLSRWYAGPLDQESLRPILDKNLSSPLTVALPKQMRRGFKTLADFLAESKSNAPKERCTSVSVEFTRLFRAPNRQYSPPPPYESVYLSESGQVFQESTIVVLNEYRRFGLSLVDWCKGEPPDHISFELDFMRFLCAEEAEAWKAADFGKVSTLLRAEKAFLENHLLTWVPKLCQNIKVYGQLGLFKGLADLTEGWIRLDRDLVQECFSAIYQLQPEIKTSERKYNREYANA